MAVRFQKGLLNYTEKLCGGRKCLLSQRQLETDNRLTGLGRVTHTCHRSRRMNAVTKTVQKHP